VFSYGIDTGELSGQTVVEMIEAIYIAFRRAIEQMALNSTCDCNACANLGALDLKFMIHHGEFLIQTIGANRELVGSEVIVAHRLAKNKVTPTTGVRAYAIYTTSAVEALDIAHLTGEWIPHREVYDTGEVECWVADMTPAWEAARNRSVIEIPESEYRGKASVEIALPVERVWDRLADPEYRRILVGSDRQVRAGKGRLGRGDVYQCHHGDNVVPSVILEWLPFTRILTRDQNPRPRVDHPPAGRLHPGPDRIRDRPHHGLRSARRVRLGPGRLHRRRPRNDGSRGGSPRRLQGAYRDGCGLAGWLTTVMATG
jgi:hypothetical protein